MQIGEEVVEVITVSQRGLIEIAKGRKWRDVEVTADIAESPKHNGSSTTLNRMNDLFFFTLHRWSPI